MAFSSEVWLGHRPQGTLPSYAMHAPVYSFPCGFSSLVACPTLGPASYLPEQPSRSKKIYKFECKKIYK